MNSTPKCNPKRLSENSNEDLAAQSISAFLIIITLQILKKFNYIDVLRIINLLKNHLSSAISISFKSSPLEFNQHVLFPSNIFDLFPEDHEYYLYTDLFQQLDTSAVERGYKIKGQNANHPRLIVSILILRLQPWRFRLPANR